MLGAMSGVPAGPPAPSTLEAALGWLTAHAPAFQAVGAILGPVVLIVGFVFTIRQIRHNRAVLEDTQKSKTFDFLMGMFEKFYDLNKIDQKVRLDFEYRFKETIAPPLEKWFVYPEKVTEEEMSRFVALDALLNFFEIVAHASADPRFLGGVVFRDVMFSYWFEQMKDDAHSILRRYLLLSYEALRARLGFEDGPVLLAVYGTLRRPQENAAVPQEIRSRMKRLGKCLIPGRIYEIAEHATGARYPGLIVADPSEGARVAGELFEIGENDRVAAVVLRALDPYEEFDPGDLHGSAFRRTFMPVYRSDTEKAYAWVYVYNRPVADDRRIEGGDWATHTGS
jgi:gamma-glutamylcyclotransferase (GGCT)/AIG2-like uncharacterized protein YtfP